MENITNSYNPWWCKTGLIVSTSDEITKLYHSLFTGRLVNANSLITGQFIILISIIDLLVLPFFAIPLWEGIRYFL